MTEKLFSPVDYAVPFFILLVILEMLWVRRNAPEKYEPRDTLTSLALGTGSTVAGALFGGTMFAIAMWGYDLRITTIRSRKHNGLHQVLGIPIVLSIRTFRLHEFGT